MADYPPLDPLVFCKIEILKLINVKRDELGLTRIHHDLNLDKISRRFNEIRLSSELSENEIRDIVNAEFNITNVEIGPKGSSRENFKTFLFHGK